MTRRKPRGLTEDEKTLWSEVAKRTERLEKQRVELPIQKPKKAPKVSNPRAPLSPFKIGTKATPKPIKHDVLPALSDRMANASVQMDHKSFGKMKRGKLTPEGRIDLHGMTLAQAHPALNAFILASHSAGKRLVLVITGKGKNKDDFGPIPVRLGVLRHQVPQWLAQAPISSVVLQVTEAHGKHGGGGAFYVYLRRQR